MFIGFIGRLRKCLYSCAASSTSACYPFHSYSI